MLLPLEEECAHTKMQLWKAQGSKALTAVAEGDLDTWAQWVLFNTHKTVLESKAGKPGMVATTFNPTWGGKGRGI